jgi:atypical dual specificity phosphatase
MTISNFSWLIENKLAGHSAPESEADLIWLETRGIKALVRMTEKELAKVSTIQVQKIGLLDCYEPVNDSKAPKPAQIDKIIGFIGRCLSENRPVGVSCRAGYGRTGTILACYFVSKGIAADVAMEKVRLKRPGSIETSAQEEATKRYAHWLGY